MSERQRDEQIRQAFSALTRPPRPQLTERIRDGLWTRAASARAPLPLPPPLAVLVAGLLVLALVAAVLEGPAAVRSASAIGRGVNGAVSRALTPPRTAATASERPAGTRHASPSAPATEAPTATPAPTEAPTPTPVPAPTAPLPTLPGYSCATQSGGGGQTTMATARVGAQKGYDRFVIRFAGPVPQFEVALLASPSFAPDSGPVTLPGGAGLQVTLHGASGAYAGPSDVKPGLSEIREARLLSNSQGVALWGVGIDHAACFHAWVLPSPSRLVIDVAG